MSERKFKYVGTRPIRHDGVEKVTGRANYGADIVLPGMLHGAVARSEHAHARILSIDTSEAEAMAGVHAVITGADFPDIPSQWRGDAGGGIDFGAIAVNVMARDKAFYHGHALAAVAATTQAIAQEACRRACRHVQARRHTVSPQAHEVTPAGRRARAGMPGP